MRSPSRLFAAGTLLAVCACQDNPTAPGDEDVSAARSTTKNATEVRTSAVQYGADGTVTYSVRVRSNSRTLSSFQGTVMFAPGIFELRSQTTTPVAGGTSMVNVSDISNGRIRFSAYTQSAFNASGEGTEVFRFVVQQVRSGDPALSSVLDVVGTTPHSTTSSSGGTFATIAAQSCTGTSLWGDGNADGNVNITDAQQLARFSTGLAVGNWTAVTTQGDVTADGSVNIVDAQQVARYSVGLPAAPRTSTWIC